MRVCLINPNNPAVGLTKLGKWNKLNKYRIWKPLSLLILARLTPSEWETEVIDENLGWVDYGRSAPPGPGRHHRLYVAGHEGLPDCRTSGSKNFADDDELLELARRPGCLGVFIGFESTTVIARTCDAYGIDTAHVLKLTPLPGTALYEELQQQDRIPATDYPEDWQYYTLCHPVADYKNFTCEELLEERNRFGDLSYSYPKILRRVIRRAALNWKQPRKAFACLIANLSCRYNHVRGRKFALTASTKGRPPFFHRLFPHRSPRPMRKNRCFVRELLLIVFRKGATYSPAWFCSVSPVIEHVCSNEQVDFE